MGFGDLKELTSYTGTLFDVLTSYISFRRVPSSEKATSQRNGFQPIAAQLPRSAVALPVAPWPWRCYGNKTTKWRHIIDTVRAHIFWNEMRRNSCSFNSYNNSNPYIVVGCEAEILIFILYHSKNNALQSNDSSYSWYTNGYHS